jgi:DNA topoisomerase-1
LIKELEEQGIGRPSTYVPIISTIQDRGYAEQEQRRFMPTWLGETVNEVMNKHFPDIVDVGFTADMERKLDDVEEGRQSWKEFLRHFYGDFKVSMDKAETEMNRVQKPVEELDEACPECGRNLVIRTGRFGRFISCSGFPECRYGRSVVTKTGALCPNCGGDLVERKTKQKKRIFYGCNNYPTCNFAIWEKPVPELCPNCNGLMVVTRVGADPVCYQEVIVPRRSSEEKPHQNGAAPRRAARKRPAEAGETPQGAPAKPATRSRATRRVSATTATRSATKKSTTRAATKKTTASLAKKKTTVRTKKS